MLFGEADLGEEYEEAVKGESEPGETVVFKRLKVFQGNVGCRIPETKKL